MYIFTSQIAAERGTLRCKITQNETETVKSSNKPLAFRYNENKPRFDLIEYDLLEPMAIVLGFGAQKYDVWNWKQGLHASTNIASLMRHLAALQSGEEYDKESGIHHIGHMMCNLLFLADTYKNHRSLIDTLQQTKLEFPGWIKKKND